MWNQTLSVSFEVHITCVSIIIVFGTLTNGLLLFIFFKNKNSTNIGNVYLVTLAILDLIACYTAIFIPILKLLVENGTDTLYNTIFTSFTYIRGFIRINNLSQICLMSIDRLWAVFKPFTYRYYISHARAIISASLILSALEIISFAVVAHSVIVIIIGSHVFLGLITICTVYPAIAYKLYVGERRRILDIQLRQPVAYTAPGPSQR